MVAAFLGVVASAGGPRGEDDPRPSPDQRLSGGRTAPLAMRATGIETDAYNVVDVEGVAKAWAHLPAARTVLVVGATDVLPDLGTRRYDAVYVAYDPVVAEALWR